MNADLCEARSVSMRAFLAMAWEFWLEANKADDMSDAAQNAINRIEQLHNPNEGVQDSDDDELDHSPLKVPPSVHFD